MLIDIAPHRRLVAADTRAGGGSISAPLNSWTKISDVL
jgi:hypothetical protein